jgi:uncharacterized protein (DUF1778 family)
MDDDSNLRRIVANPDSGVSPESPEFAFALCGYRPWQPDGFKLPCTELCRTIERIKEQMMATANRTSKSARIETRVSQEQKDLIERAAAFSGRTVSEFVLAHVEVAAKKVIDEHEKLHLDQVQSRSLVDALLTPKKPNKKLKLAMEDYRKRVESR